MKRLFVLVVLLGNIAVVGIQAQSPLERRGVHKWSVSSGIAFTGAMAYAKTANLLFVGRWNSSVLVIDTRSGKVVDSILMSDYPELGFTDQQQQRAAFLGTTDDASLVVYGYEFLTRTLMIEYPSKRLLDESEMNIGEYYSRSPDFLIALSSKGNLLAIDDAVIDRRTGETWPLQYPESHVSFNRSETAFAYRVKDTVNGVEISNGVAVRTLGSNEIRKITQCWGRPHLSADGEKVMTYGSQWLTSSLPSAIPPIAAVYSLQRSEFEWELHGDTNSPYPGDFSLAFWGEGGTMFLGRRSSPSLQPQDRGRLFMYRVGSAIPLFVVNDSTFTRNALTNDDLTEVYDLDLATDQYGKVISAVDLSKTAVGVRDDDRQRERATDLFPVPVQDILFATCVGGARSMRMTSLDGRQYRLNYELVQRSDRSSLTTYIIRIPNGTLSGVYTLSVEGDEGAFVHRPFVIR